MNSTEQIDFFQKNLLEWASSNPRPMPWKGVKDPYLIWLSEIAFDKKGSYLVRTATDLVPVTNIEISALLDLETLATHPAHACSVNDIALADIALGRATAIDRFIEAPETGSFMLVDAITGATIAGGVVISASPDAKIQENIFLLTQAMLRRGLCSDLKNSPDDEKEFRRQIGRAHV